MSRPHYVPTSRGKRQRLLYGRTRNGTRVGVRTRVRRRPRGPGSEVIRRPRLQPRTKMRLASRSATITEQLRKIREKQEWCCADKAKHIHRWINLNHVHCAANVQQLGTMNQVNHANLHTAMDGIRILDPSTGAIKKVDIGDLVNSQQMQVNGIYSSLKITNSGTAPCQVDVYFLRPKIATNDTPGTTWTAGLTNQRTDLTTTQSIGGFMTDSSVFNSTWRVEKSWKVKLNVGQTSKHSGSISKFTFKPTMADATTLAYQPSLGACLWSVVVRGHIAHDPLDHDKLGFSPAGVDIEGLTKYDFEYDAGVKLDDISITHQTLEPTAVDYGQQPQATIAQYVE